MKSKYIDTPAIVQVIAGVYTKPDLIDNEKYDFNIDDFIEEFHKIIFGSIYNLYKLGATKITSADIENYLKDKPQKLATYELNKGPEYLANLPAMAQLSSFDYYYERMKKMTLFRGYEHILGMDMRWLYDPSEILDIKKAQKQAEWLDSTSIEEIVNIVDKKIDEIKLKYVDNATDTAAQAGMGIQDLLERLKQKPDFGYPMYGRYINTIFRGARLGKYYLRSAPSGVGKSRAMVGDACFFACDRMYDKDLQKWVDIGTREPTLYITVEQTIEEIQQMMIAFLSGVDEDTLVRSECNDDEWQRVQIATDILAKAPLYIKTLPDFTMKDVENIIKVSIRDFGCKYIAYDYLQSSARMMMEIGGKAGIKGLREDQVLFLLSAKLKDIAVMYDVFVLSATQLSGAWQDADFLDQNYLRGSRAIADRIDAGMIMTRMRPVDIDKIKPLVDKLGLQMPNTKVCIYKNRGGRYKDVILWCLNDQGCCRLNPLFMTGVDLDFIDIKDTKINVNPEILASAF